MPEVSKSANPSVGSSFDDFLKDEGVYEVVTAQSIKQANGWKFKNLDEPWYTDTWYDIFKPSLLDPFDLLEDENQAQALKEALALVGSFLNSAEKTGVLEWT